MNNLQDRIRDELHRQAGREPFRPMPKGTVGRVRARQGRVVVASALVLCLIAGGGIALTRVLPTTGKARPAATGPTSPVPSSTVTAEPPSPSPSFGAWPVITLGGDFTPYMGEISGAHAGVLAYGTVDGIPWSAVASDSCIGLFIRKDGGTFCTDASPESRPGLDLESIASGGVATVGYVGVISSAVTRVEVHLDDGQTRAVDLIPGPSDGGLSYFVLFPPPRAPGQVVALGASGDVVGTAPLCGWRTELSPNESVSHPCTP